LLFPAIVGFCCIGTYTINSKRIRHLRDGVLRRLRLSVPQGSSASPAPLILGFVLGPLMEENLRRALADFTRQTRWCSWRSRSGLGFLIASILLLIVRDGPGDQGEARRGVAGVILRCHSGAPAKRRARNP